MPTDELYKEEVELWLVNHNSIYLFFWGISVVLGALFLMPFEVFWWKRYKVRR